MKLKSSMLLVTGLAVLGAFAGCDNKIKDENALLLKENDALRGQLAQRNEALTAAEKERLAADARAADADQRLKDMDSAPPTLAAAEGTTGGVLFIDENITVNTTAEGVNMTIPGDVLFDSGSATLKGGAKKSLDKMIAMIKSDYSGNKIRVSGFTDNDPIKRSKFETNYHLAFARAYAVGQYLGSNGIDGADVAFASYGPQQPMATKAGSRRVEVLVIR
ncbi:MAG: OmpA family protein [Planctomycetota bacterium]|nr:OmpA family protein [Planctomycetota bacterium]MDA1105072.1 OmpA family protein [Planctomycetota bacterium]